MVLLRAHRKLLKRAEQIFVVGIILLAANVLWGYFNRRPLIVMIGDSTTMGSIDTRLINTPQALQQLLIAESQGVLMYNNKDLRYAKVINLGIAGFSSSAWVTPPTFEACTWARKSSDQYLRSFVGIRVLRSSCDQMAAPIAVLISTLGRTPDVALVNLGFIGANETPEETVKNLTIIRQTLGPTTLTLFASPLHAVDDRQARLEALTKLLKDRALLHGPDFNAYSLSTVDGIHLAQEEYAIIAKLWINALARP